MLSGTSAGPRPAAARRAAASDCAVCLDARGWKPARPQAAATTSARPKPGSNSTHSRSDRLRSGAASCAPRACRSAAARSAKRSAASETSSPFHDVGRGRRRRRRDAASHVLLQQAPVPVFGGRSRRDTARASAAGWWGGCRWRSTGRSRPRASPASTPSVARALRAARSAAWTAVRLRQEGPAGRRQRDAARQPLDQLAAELDLLQPRICCESDGWAMPTRSAPFVNDPSSATASRQAAAGSYSASLSERQRPGPCPMRAGRGGSCAVRALRLNHVSIPARDVEEVGALLRAGSSGWSACRRRPSPST